MLYTLNYNAQAASTSVFLGCGIIFFPPRLRHFHILGRMIERKERDREREEKYEKNKFEHINCSHVMTDIIMPFLLLLFSLQSNIEIRLYNHLSTQHVDLHLND